MSHKIADSWSRRRPIPTLQVGALHVFGPGRLHAVNSQVEFNGTGDRRLRVPLRDLTLVCLYGPARVTPSALRLLAGAGASLAFLSANGNRLIARVDPPGGAAHWTRHRQYRAALDPAWRLDQARAIVAEKLETVADILRDARRHGRATDSTRRLLAELNGLTARVNVVDLNQLRGLEGLAARGWFAALDKLLPDGWSLPGRTRRPPTDPVNAMLSFGYVWLHQKAVAASLALGLDPTLGAYHAPRPGRESLACDLTEPFRAPAVDRLVLRQLAQRRFRPEDFHSPGAGRGVNLQPAALKTWIGDLEANWHAGDAETPSLQIRLVDRARRFVAELPPLPAFDSTSKADDIPH